MALADWHHELEGLIELNYPFSFLKSRVETH